MKEAMTMERLTEIRNLAKKLKEGAVPGKIYPDALRDLGNQLGQYGNNLLQIRNDMRAERLLPTSTLSDWEQAGKLLLGAQSSAQAAADAITRGQLSAADDS